MFEIRVICDPADTERISDALTTAFTTGPTRQHPTRDKKRTRLYITAEYRTHTGPWPTAEEAYALAPSIISEIGWTAGKAADRPLYAKADREFWLRKAAVLDRIALCDDTPSDAADLAARAARRLMDLDDAAVICDPRHYVRQQYAHWIKQQ
ncbi:hypothetical protein [Streptomyces sp. NBC_00120]|uniref:hypothetical protein n=1 Tax=Streptomyces sp. NBC_00120 TaxID=2975660 RepID=UPI0022567B34|nr:hypothetical protein [Streptomyces sp. NBC_00120]MCX5324301.1 hypothetical protein [Streptomyces sp. NBC_00120]